MRDERAVVAIRGAGPARPAVRIFNAAGVEAGSFLWDSPGRIAAWGWSDAQELVIVEDSGKVRLCAWGGGVNLGGFGWPVQEYQQHTSF